MTRRYADTVTDELPTANEIITTHKELEEIYDLKYRGIRVAAPRIKIRRIIRNAAEYGDDPYDRAAYLLRKLITSHYFEDANKRTAWTTILDYLDRHGLEPAKTEKGDTEPVLKAIRAFEVEELSEWLETGDIDENKFNP